MKKLILGAIVFAVIATSAQAKRKLPLSYLSFDGLHAVSSGTIYAANGAEGSKVYAVTEDGHVTDFAEGLNGPIDITNDANDNIYVSNFYSATISKITPDGEVTDFATVMEGPAGMVTDSHGNIYVAHYGGAFTADGDTIMKITPEGETSVFSQGGFLLSPTGLAIDPNDNLYTANFNEGSIIKITPEGEQSIITRIGSSGGYAIGHLAYANGRLYATGLANQKIYIIRIKNGRVKERNLVEPGDFPNGITLSEKTGEILFVNTFATAAAFTRIRVQDPAE